MFYTKFNKYFNKFIKIIKKQFRNFFEIFKIFFQILIFIQILIMKFMNFLIKAIFCFLKVTILFWNKNTSSM